VKTCYRGRKLVRVTHTMRLGTEAALKVVLEGLGFSGRLNTAFLERVNLTVRNARLSTRTPHLGHGPAVSSPLGSPRMLARLLSFGASPPSTPSGARAAATTRWQASGAALSATSSGDGSRENYPTMDGARSALFPLATGLRLRGIQARGGCRVMSPGVWNMYQQKHSIGASLQDQGACLDCPQTKNSLKEVE
jgi:hypothetical protein